MESESFVSLYTKQDLLTKRTSVEKSSRVCREYFETKSSGPRAWSCTLSFLKPEPPSVSMPTSGKDHVFVIRLWHEPNQTIAGCSWRGQLSHMNSRQHFVGLQQLFDLITRMLKSQGPSTH